MNRIHVIVVSVFLSILSGSAAPSYASETVALEFTEHTAKQGRESRTEVIRDSEEQAYLDKGFEHMAENKYENAIKAFETVLRFDPDNADAYAGLGLSYYRMGDTDIFTSRESIEKAIVYSRQSLLLGADYPENHFVIGMSQIILGNIEAAIVELDALIKQDAELALQLVNRLLEYRPRSAFQRLETEGAAEEKPQTEKKKEAVKKQDEKPDQKGSEKKEKKKRRRLPAQDEEELM